MANLTESRLYKISAWKDNAVKIVLTQGEGTNAANPNYNKKIKFQLYDGDGLLTIPSSGVDIFLAFDRTDGTSDIIEGERINESDVGFTIKNTLTTIAGIVKGEIRLISSDSIVKFYGINFNDLPSAPDSMYEGNEYTLYDCSFLGNPCSVGIAVVSNSLFDNAIWSFDIYFENTPDANDLAKKLTDIFGMEPDDREKDKSYLTWDLEGYWLALSNRKNKPCYISIH